MKKRIWKRLLGLLLSAALLAGTIPVALAAESKDGGFRWRQVDNSTVTASLERQPVPERETEEPLYENSESVRVSIELKDVPTMERFSLEQNGEYAVNSAAKSYRARLETQQRAVANAISRQALKGKRLDVVWNLTLAANIISANVEYGKIDAIKKVAGVKSVFVERQYAPNETSIGTVNPNMQFSSDMTGTQSGAWTEGYKGQGMRVAIIDTGLDTDHQSFNADAFDHALEEDAAVDRKAMTDYDLLDEEEIGGVLSQLNAAKNDTTGSLKTADVYYNAKIPFGYCYVDKDLDITHDNDEEGEHGSHVAGIAAANRYLKTGANGNDSDYTPAMDAVHMTGQAPDAQVLVMKVFGNEGGAYDSDYMAAIEDAILLGSDTINLSMGSDAPGFAREPDYAYQDIWDDLISEQAIVTLSAGNNGGWADDAVTGGKLYSDDVNFHTGGFPGSYTNSLCVASVDNSGEIGQYFTVGGRDIPYLVAEHSPDFSALDPDGTGTAYRYMVLDGAGLYPDEYVGARGKVVFVRKKDGDLLTKVQNARSAGAAACVIFYDLPYTDLIRLPDYEGSMPVVSIDQEGIGIVKAAGTSGVVTVRSGIKLTESGQTSPQYTMSYFSSWGVPGDLSLKPEITAPGGNIWSVNGAVEETDRYEQMSGTSMAAPQVAGIGALVKQFIENNQYSQAGMTDRALAQSLMMSTATPLKDEDGQYYPVLQQGAGLVNAAAATSADSYITVDGQNDGKVKFELGDDPEKSGTYQVQFDIHNLDGQVREYDLSGELFTQATKKDAESGFTMLTKGIKPLDATISWSVEGGVSIPDKSVRGCDFNDDGAVDEKDAQLLLDYVVKGTALAANADKADIDKDGNVDTHDVHVLLTKLSVESVAVPAKGKVTVTASITLDADVAAAQMADCPNGFYVEGYLKAEGKSVKDGQAGTAHSIPLLGFYGNWSDPSMFEKGSTLEYAAEGGSALPHPYTRGESTDYLNYLWVEYTDGSGAMLGRNPYDVEETICLPKRAALNSENGDTILEWEVSAIRNAAASRVTVKNAADPAQVYKDTGNMGPVEPMYYDYGFLAPMWWNQDSLLLLDWTGTDAKGDPLPEDTVAELEVTLAPEYYVQGKNVDWDSLGKGVSLTQWVTIDNTAPQLLHVENQDKTIGADKTVTLEARDNQYVAAIALLDPTGGKVLSAQCPNQMEKGVTVAVTLSLSQVVGKKFLVQVMDYACNTATYEVEYEGLESEITDPDYVFFDQEKDSWYGLENSPTQKLGVLSSSGSPIYAAEWVNGWLFALDGPTDSNTVFASTLYATPVDDIGNFEKVATIPFTNFDGKTRLGYPMDMAYSKKDQKFYILIYMEEDTGLFSYLYSLAPMTGAVELEGYPLDAANNPLRFETLTIDDAGNFYSLSENADRSVTLYQYSLSDLSTVEEKKTMPAGTQLDSSLICLECYASTDWDSTNGKLVYALTRCWPSHGFWHKGSPSAPTVIYEIDLADPEAAPTVIYTGGKDEEYHLAGFAVKDTDDALDLAPADQASGVILSETELGLAKGRSFQLEALVAPWTLENREVTWESSDSSVATVTDNGKVVAVGPGTATISATTKAAPYLRAECAVSVMAIEANLTALAYDVEARVWWSRIDPARLPSYERIKEADAEYGSTAMTEDGKMYATTYGQNLYGDMISVLYSVDPETLEGARIAPITVDDEIVYVNDLAPIPTLSQTTGTDYLLGICDGMTGLIINGATGEVEKEFALNDGATVSPVGVAFIETDYVTENGESKPRDLYAYVGTDGGVYEGYIMPSGNGVQDTLAVVRQEPNFDTGICTNRSTEFNSLVYGSAKDGKNYLFWSVYNGIDSYSNSEKLYAIDMNAGKTYLLGSFAAGVWPVSGLIAEKVPAIQEAEGGLHSIVIKDAEGHQSVEAVVVNETEKTVTLPITAAQSANGQFALSYDPTVLTFQSIAYSGSVLHSDAETPGKVAVGYADLDEINGKLAEAVFTYEPGEEEQATAISLQIMEDGGTCNTTPAEGGSAEITLPAKSAAPTPTPTPTPITPRPSKPEPEPDTPRFVDVPEGSWYHDDVYSIAEMGLVVGTGANCFSPSEKLTRGMLATILYRMAKEPETTADDLFNDVTDNRYYTKAIAWAAENDIVAGYGNGRFGPDDPITREQLVTILWRYTGSPESAGNLEKFTDGEKTSTWAIPSMLWAVENKIVSGKGDGILDPTGKATRAEVAAMLIRYCEKTK